MRSIAASGKSLLNPRNYIPSGSFILGPSPLNAFSIVQATQVNALDKSDKKPASPLGFLASVFLAPWYSSFKIANSVAPPGDQNQGNKKWLHTLGKILIPSYYSAFQLAKMKNSDTTQDKILPLLFPKLYGAYAATMLNRQNASLSSTGSANAAVNNTPGDEFVAKPDFINPPANSAPSPPQAIRPLETPVPQRPPVLSPQAPLPYYPPLTTASSRLMQTASFY